MEIKPMIYGVRAWPLRSLTRPRLGLVGYVSDMVVGTSEFPPMQLQKLWTRVLTWP